MSLSAHSLFLYIAEHTRLVPKTEELSAANQNRALRHPSQAPESSANQNRALTSPLSNTRVISQSESSITSPSQSESSITSPESSARAEDPSWLGSSRLAIFLLQ